MHDPSLWLSFFFFFFSLLLSCNISNYMFLSTGVDTCAHVRNVQMSWSKVEENVQCVKHP